MTPELHRQFENSSPYGMIRELKSMFEKQARVERFHLIQTFHACKQKEGKPVGPYVLKMKGYVEQLERLGYVLPQDISVGLILNGLTSDFAGFVINYNMHNMGKNSKGKDKSYIPKPKNHKPSVKEHPTKDDACHHCKEVRHWKRNWIVYMAELIMKKKKVVEAIGSYDLVLPNDLVICLDNCHYAPTITRGVVSVPHLVDNGFIQCFTNYGISVLKNDVLYFNAISSNGKMTRKSFPHRPKRATDLLGIIHIDVCGPLRHVSKQGPSYFITFTDYYTRYGYVYLLKHKHEVFETFKLTPLYTPQHNSVSERRNCTLLDMVRSMMNLITLSLSFWDYALESATRILNMVLTKKVDKTPYELWYGKVPNMSYLKVWGCEALVKRDTPDKLQQRSINGRAIDLEEIQDEDTSPSEITSEIPMEVEGFEPPQEEEIPIRRSERSHSESNKWIDAMNAEIQSIMDNMVWVLVDLPPGCKTVG
ncbi:retrotransposon protein, putative, ty1-copia subclass, partial [Tanacetum coccineum]